MGAGKRHGVTPVSMIAMSKNVFCTVEDDALRIYVCPNARHWIIAAPEYVVVNIAMLMCTGQLGLDCLDTRLPIRILVNARFPARRPRPLLDHKCLILVCWTSQVAAFGGLDHENAASASTPASIHVK